MLFRSFSGRYLSIATLYYRSQASAAWNLASTWETSTDGITWLGTAALVPPDDANSSGIIVRAGDVVTVTSDVSADDLIVDGTLTINAGQTFTVADGTAATDMLVSTSGIVNNSGVVTSTGTTAFDGNATYNHTQNGGILPTATWSSASNLNITFGASAALNGLSQAFGNFSYTGGASVLTMNQAPIIKGNLIINSGTLADNGNTITVNGSVINNGIQDRKSVV